LSGPSRVSPERISAIKNGFPLYFQLLLEDLKPVCQTKKERMKERKKKRKKERKKERKV